MKKRILAAILILLMLPSLVGCQLGKNPVREAEQAIDAIGTVNLSSGEILDYCDTLVNAMEVPERMKISNKSLLDQARAEYDRQQKLAANATEAINAIGTVTVTSGDAITAARAAYDKVSEYDVSGTLKAAKDTLEDAEKQFAQKAQEVSDLMDNALSLYKAQRYEAVELLLVPEMEELSQIPEAYAFAGLLVKAICAHSQAEFDSQNYVKAVDELMGAKQYKSLCDSGTYAEVDQKLSAYALSMNKNTPKNGKVLSRTQKAGRNTIKITAGPNDTVAKVERVDDPSQYVKVFIQANKSVTVYLLNGTYKVKYTTGPIWFDENNLFGDSATFIELSGTAEMAGFTEKIGKVSYSYRNAYTVKLTQGYGSSFGQQNTSPSCF